MLPSLPDVQAVMNNRAHHAVVSIEHDDSGVQNAAINLLRDTPLQVGVVRGLIVVLLLCELLHECHLIAARHAVADHR